MTDTPQSGAIGNENLRPKMNGAPDDNSRPASFVSAVSSQLQTTDTPASSATQTTAGAEREEEEWTPPTNGPLKTPIPKHSRHSKIAPQPKLTAEQESKYTTVLEQVSQWTTIPTSTAKGAPQAPLEEHERMFLTRECLLRYLRATKWKPVDAVRRLQETLSWRREYGADTFTHDYISPENETGKQVQLGFDNDGRPCLYLNPGKQNTKMSDRQIHHLCYMLDRTIDMMPAGVENSALIINFQGAASGTVPSVGQARAVLNILQGHNPERLGKALISKTPWYVNTFFKLVSPFIDPVTREKMKFNEDLRKYIPVEQLWKDDGGDLNFEYDHAVYWPAFDEECKKRRESYRKRWEEGGKKLGEYEEYLRGGSQSSLQQISGQADEAATQPQSQDADMAAEGAAKLTV
ncbi:CRAL-TRIO domain-containing protein [Fulvia fulva]|uniref:CRAL-TRIO domain-containing protein n=1 Tax=Passalora fulva TaxID=5499 RepID=A0A9Q8P4P6_PASFU|nr:CRAL-TRIO domain-containing protein [Fulvia fulva]KAK4632058.1 CRAL-TRIO domain-containing protein [Fulvia fulva]KAK4633005.1 CRAL-TRIO domain-containing protein [Fulvia fulva]UJO13305.1 CRAL-TRIO domain-containing protein [Fulvia fulva]WPV11778.1 CRAL-TRIO domain-containing protein [Fulvia fulva]WPV25515.1 CRAL-TRIO domain-containing protein [Fulvia fulva]